MFAPVTAAEKAQGLLHLLHPVMAAVERVRVALAHHEAQEEPVLRERTDPDLEAAVFELVHALDALFLDSEATVAGDL